MSKERYVEHTVALELPIRDSVTKGNYNLADIETKYLPIQTEVVSDNKDKTINKLQQRIAEFKKQLEEKEKLIERLQGVIDKLRDKKFTGKTLVEAVNAVYEPLFKNKCDEVEEFKQQLAELKEKLAQYENIEKEIGCDIEVFWKVYRRLSGHGKSDIHLYSIFNNEIVEIMPTEIISGTYSNYPQDCSFKYSIWDKICESYQETYSYFHFHDYNNEWFLSKEEAEAKLEELKGENK